MNYLKITNNQTVQLSAIPTLNYTEFMTMNIDLLKDRPDRHCVNYFGVKTGQSLTLYCCMADDTSHEIFVSRTTIDAPTASNADSNLESDSVTKLESNLETVTASGANTPVPSFTAQNNNFEKFEREIHENFGVNYSDHPWLKPMRYAQNRFEANSAIADYPFYQIDSEELHEVGVGPIHAGIIEPAHFRFICDGEQILHLEMQLGYQHRGLEQLFLKKTKTLERATLAENISGDTTVGHSSAFCNLWESLCDFTPEASLQFSRTLAQELERIAIHTGDMSALCGDIGYQLGSSVYGRLRTPIINFLQEWGGNRLAKGLIRPGKMNYPFTPALAQRMLDMFKAYEPDYTEMTKKFFRLPSALSRMEKTGIVSYDQLLKIGAVGMTARMNALKRDIRTSHPYNLYGSVIAHEPIIKHHGDVYSRVRIWNEEIHQSIAYCKLLIENIPEFHKPENSPLIPGKDKFTLSLVEGWRGEICHCAITDSEGQLKAYKIKDPSLHNWMALTQAVRNNGISDFPICNKSFNLSYSGHDL